MKGDSTGWRNTAYGYYKNGISVRTEHYRLTKYFRKEKREMELYDHENDPNETKNIIGLYPELVNELSLILEEGNTGLFDE